MSPLGSRLRTPTTSMASRARSTTQNVRAADAYRGRHAQSGPTARPATAGDRRPDGDPRRDGPVGGRLRRARGVLPRRSAPASHHVLAVVVRARFRHGRLRAVLRLAAPPLTGRKGGRDQEWPNGSALSESVTDPGSWPSGPPTTSMRNSSTSGAAGGGVAGTTTASECAPQPWSTDTTRPSSGAYSLEQAPKP